MGRTTTLICYTLALLEQAITKDKFSVLIIDSDMEAPGITYWFNKLKKPNVSFIHFLEAIHYPSASDSTTIDFFVNELKKPPLLKALVKYMFSLRL